MNQLEDCLWDGDTVYDFFAPLDGDEQEHDDYDILDLDG